MGKPAETKRRLAPAKIFVETMRFVKNEQNRVFNETGSEPTVAEIIEALIRSERQPLNSGVPTPLKVVASQKPAESTSNVPEEWLELVSSALHVAENAPFARGYIAIAKDALTAAATHPGGPAHRSPDTAERNRGTEKGADKDAGPSRGDDPRPRRRGA